MGSLAEISTIFLKTSDMIKFQKVIEFLRNFLVAKYPPFLCRFFEKLQLHEFLSKSSTWGMKKYFLIVYFSNMGSLSVFQALQALGGNI